MHQQKVKVNETFSRDIHSKAILNGNKEQLKKYRAKKERAQNIDKMLQELQDQIRAIQVEQLNIKLLIKNIQR